MLDPAKPLLLGGGQQFAVADDASGGVGVIGIDAEYEVCRHIQAVHNAAGYRELLAQQ